MSSASSSPTSLALSAPSPVWHAGAELLALLDALAWSCATLWTLLAGELMLWHRRRTTDCAVQMEPPSTAPDSVSTTCTTAAELPFGAKHSTANTDAWIAII